MSVLASDGRALIVAMDHARTHGVIEGSRDPGTVLDTVIGAGADYLKTYYTGSPESFGIVVENCPAPCLITGGPRMNSVEETLHVVAGAMDAGAKGVVFGRKIWQSKDPAGMVRAQQRVIHGRASVTEAMESLGQARLARQRSAAAPE